MLKSPHALAEDHASLIGAAASVVFMSLSISCALALIDVSLPVQFGGASSPASSGGKLQVSDPPTPVDAQPSAPKRTEDPPPVRCDPQQQLGAGGPADQSGCPARSDRTVSEARVDAKHDVAPPAPTRGDASGPPSKLRVARPLPAAVATLSVLPAPRRSMLRRPARHVDPAEQVEAAPEQPRAHPQPTPVAAPRVAPSREPPVAGLITSSMLRRLSAALNLSPEQRALYLPLERQLLAIGAQQKALISAGQDPKDAFGIGTAMSMYGTAQPFLNALREDQKERVRAEARSLGFGFAAAQI